MAALSLLGTSLFVGPAQAAHVTCGMTVTADITLHADVGPCAGTGLVVAASGTAPDPVTGTPADPITIDLNGHRLFGTSGPTSSLDLGVGVLIDGFSYVTVTSSVAGGQIDGFDAAVRIDGLTGPATHNTVSNLTIRDNFPEALTGSDDGEGVAIVGPQADDNTVTANTIVNNGPFGGVSVYLGNSTDKITGTEISDNTIRDNRNRSSQTDGIRLENWTWSSTVTDNTVTGSSLDGIALFADTQSNTLSDNEVTGNGDSGATTHRPGDGIHVFARTSANTIDDNTVSNNAGQGIVLDGPVGANAGASNSTVTNNTAQGNGTSMLVLGSPFFDLKDGNLTPACDNNTWSGNSYGTRNQTCIN